MKKEDLVALGLTEELAEQVATASAEELKGYIPKARFDEVNTEKNTLKTTLAERDTQLADLQNASQDSEALNQQIAELIRANTEAQAKYDADIKQLKIDNAIEKALGDAGALNSKAVKALLELTDVELSEDGNIKGLDKQIEKLKGADDSKFLFKAEPSNPQIHGASPANSSAGAPAGTDTTKMTYSQMVEFLEANPGATI